MQGAGDGTSKYSGKVGTDDSGRVDAAYRVLADHLRIISAAAASYCAKHFKHLLENDFYFIFGHEHMKI